MGSLSDDEVIQAVKWRYRVCNYLFRVAVGWLLAGMILRWSPILSESTGWSAGIVEAVGVGILCSAFALAFAIYRCPICDRLLSRFSAKIDHCSHCSAKIR